MQKFTRRDVLAAAFLIAAIFASDALLAAAMSPAEVAKGYLAAWNAKDVDKAASFYADDVEYFDVTLAEAHKGKDAAREVVQVFVTAAPDLKWEMKGDPIVSDDGIAFQWTFSGTNPDGTTFENRGRSIEVVRRQPDGSWRFTIDLPSGAS